MEQLRAIHILARVSNLIYRRRGNMKIKINSILEKKGLTIYWLSKETGISYAAINIVAKI